MGMKRLMQKIVLMATVCLCTHGQGISAQEARFSTDTIVTRYNIHSQMFSPEKLYLHLDRGAYCAGETIWFCGYLRNASEMRQGDASNFIYVELARPDGSVEKRVKVKRSGESFPGYIFLPEDLERGKYFIRAYSLAQLDSPEEFMFHQELTILGPEPQSRRKHKGDEGGRDVTFYPEGGRYFEGSPSRIGVKVMDRSGRSLDLRGQVICEDGSVVAGFETYHDGMGQIQFIPEPGRRYMLKCEDGEMLPLPAPASDGATISVTRYSGKLLIRIAGQSAGHYCLLLRDISSMRPVSELDLSGAGEPVSFLISESDLSEGINHLILMDGSGRIVSERLLFEYSSAQPSLQVAGGIHGSGIREPASFSVSLNGPDGAPLDGTFSVSVTGASLAQCQQDDGIDSYMLLSSELRGRINEPRWYFDPSIPLKERVAAMDMLMMIQGWSYYDLAQIADPRAVLDSREHAREMTQFIRGKVERSLSSKAPVNFFMTVLFPALDRSCMIPVSQGKRFVLDSLDFEEGNGVMIKITRNSGSLDYIPSWDGDEFAPERAWAGAAGHAGSAGAVGRDWESADSIPLDYVSTDTLKAAVVSADAVSSQLGVSGHTLPREDYKMFASKTLIEYLRLKAPNFMYRDGQMSSTRTSALNMYGQHTEASEWDQSPVQLVVDGCVEPWVGFENITISEIESIEVSTDPNPIFRARDGVVAIRLQYGARVTHLSDTEPSLIYFTPLGYQSPQKFYAPRYDNGTTSADEDRRNTLFWNPQLRVVNGRAECSFYTDDRPAAALQLHLRLEGVTASGLPLSASFVL